MTVWEYRRLQFFTQENNTEQLSIVQNMSINFCLKRSKLSINHYVKITNVRYLISCTEQCNRSITQQNSSVNHNIQNSAEIFVTGQIQNHHSYNYPNKYITAFGM
jgi:hypothetical protein